MREIGNISILGNLTWDLEVAGYNPGVEPPTSIHNIDVEQELFGIFQTRHKILIVPPVSSVSLFMCFP